MSALQLGQSVVDESRPFMVIARGMDGNESVTVLAHAKINLFLEVLGRRDDGYHELRSVLAPVALCDTLVLHRTETDTTIDVRFEGIPPTPLGDPSANLAVRAAALAFEAAGKRGGVRISLCKRIPVGGGLGGGSADAAAVLIGINRLYRLGLSQSRLLQVGARLGSDVPALVRGGAVCMRGRGERVRALCRPDPGRRGFALVLAYPGFPSPTAQIYRSCTGRLTAPAKWYTTMVASVRREDLPGACSVLFNSLQEKVFEQFPLVQTLYGRLRDAGSPGVLVSGSGASVFALAADEGQAETIRKSLPGDCWNVVTRTLPDGVMVAHGPLEP